VSFKITKLEKSCIRQKDVFTGRSSYDCGFQSWSWGPTALHILSHLLSDTLRSPNELMIWIKCVQSGRQNMQSSGSSGPVLRYYILIKKVYKKIKHINQQTIHDKIYNMHLTNWEFSFHADFIKHWFQFRRENILQSLAPTQSNTWTSELRWISRNNQQVSWSRVWTKYCRKVTHQEQDWAPLV